LTAGSLYLHFDRYVEVRDGLQSALTEMERAAADLRIVSREHGVRVANAATDMDVHYFHLSVMTRACGKMNDVAEKLENATSRLFNVLHEESPPHEVQEEYISWNIDDLGWV
jgi:hypothetical protein